MGRTSARRKIVAHSFLGVGAPEAILVAVVALVVFGPKGLADAAKSVGQALRAFQPTIREVVEVSQDLRGTLEKELGLDEIREAARVPMVPRTPATTAMASSSASDEDPDIEAKRAASAAAAWDAAPAGAAPATAAPGVPPAAANIPQQLQQPGKDIGSMTMEELEAELARRKAAGGSGAPAAAGGQQQQPKQG